MAEHDTIVLYNPTNEDFTQNFNGEPYTIPAKMSKSFAQFVGFHVAKHLATKMVFESFRPGDRADQKKAVTISQHLVYDNPKLRIALYKILRDIDVVGKVITSYPYKGFIGDMKEYERFVEENKDKPLSEESKDSEKN